MASTLMQMAVTPQLLLNMHYCIINYYVQFLCTVSLYGGYSCRIYISYSIVRPVHCTNLFS